MKVVLLDEGEIFKVRITPLYILGHNVREIHVVIIT
jgi:hypothetical protein